MSPVSLLCTYISKVYPYIFQSGNNATLSTTTINDHQSRAYFRKNRTKQHSHTTTLSPSQTTISHYFPLTQPSQSTQTFSSPQKHPVSPSLTHTDYTLPSKHHKTSHPSHPNRPQLSHTPPTSPTPYITLSPLTEEPPCSTPNIELQLPPHYRFEQPSHLQNCTPTEILSRLQLFSYDVPANGDCFYNAIQLYLHHLPHDPFFISIPQLRSRIAHLLTSTSTGSNILKQYHQNSQVITTSILPSLNPSLHPHRDIAASDYVIAATATLLNSSITIYRVFMLSCVDFNIKLFPFNI